MDHRYTVELSFNFEKFPNMRGVTHRVPIEKGSSEVDSCWIQYGFKTLQGARRFAFKAKRVKGHSAFYMIRIFLEKQHIVTDSVFVEKIL